MWCDVLCCGGCAVCYIVRCDVMCGCVALWWLCGVLYCVMWCGVLYCVNIVWCDMVWCGVVRHVVWCGVVVVRCVILCDVVRCMILCGVVLCRVVWCGVVLCRVVCVVTFTLTTLAAFTGSPCFLRDPRKAFLTPEVRARKNLHVAPYSEVSRVLFERDTATGVEFTNLTRWARWPCKNACCLHLCQQ